jgi:hypothetical protein
MTWQSIPLFGMSGAFSSVLENPKARFIYTLGRTHNRLHVNFGFGIGMAHKEDMLAISEANDSVTVEPGMIFHARITFKE